MKAQIAWKGDEDRAMQLKRPCQCGCDTRDGSKGVGYITGSDEAGNGFTIWIQTEAVYQAALKVFRQEGILVEK